MNTIELTTSEFRQNQKKFLDLAARGVSIVICRGKELFLLNRIHAEQTFDSETMAKIEEARAQFGRGETTKINNKEELQQFLNSI